MVFSSFDFIFKFIPIFFVLYCISPGKWKNLCLLAGSLFFYFYGIKDHPLYMIMLVFSIYVNYRVGIRIGRRPDRNRGRNKWLVRGIIYNLSWLLLFKYSGFMAKNINSLLSWAGVPTALPVFSMPLPLGISFYTFQAISYLVDVYRRDVSPETSLVNLGIYISMFPHLIAGPIVINSAIGKQIRKRRHSLKNVEDGLREFTIGLGLKVLLANQLGSLWKQVGGIGYESISTPLAWLGLIAFSLQIYFDFYGYSLMAKGLGKLMGFQLPDNFNYPYMSTSMTEFWRRWHMTLGSWFKNYIYIPLGGNRSGRLRSVLNLFIVWLLTGLWHGAGWNFILWGMTLFLLIFVERLGLKRIFLNCPMAGHLYMMLIIPLTWLIFAVTDLSQMAVYFQRLFPFLAGNRHFSYYAGDIAKYGRLYFLPLAAGLVLMTNMPRKIYERIKYSFVSAVILAAIFWLCIYSMKMGANDPFLYFRF